MTAELLRLDATAQADLIRRREIQPVDLVNAAIARIEQVNPALNAVISTRFEQARAEAVVLPDNDQPFRGVPLLLKDFMCQTAGDLYSEGSRLLRDLGWRSTQDTYLAQKFRAAGFIFLGKTALPEFARSPVTESEAFGITRNPWDMTRTPGGSSGGSAAAVAAGMVALAHGNDGYGSIRIPAACCGLVGLKPSRGRMSTGPGNSGGLLGNIAEFVLTKSVRDAAHMLDALAGNMPGDLFNAPPLLQPCRDAIHLKPQKLRIGLLVKDVFLQAEVDADCVNAVESTAKLLESMGHSVEYSHPPALEGATGLGLAAHIISSSGMAARMDAWSEKIGRPIVAQDVEPGTWDSIEFGRIYSAVQVHAAQQRLVAGAGRAPEWWAAGYDLLITPTMNQPAPPVAGDLQEAGKIFGLYAMAFSISGQPAISLPVHRTASGLPVGIQMVADYGREDLLLAVAAQLEEALNWQKWLDDLQSR